MDDGAIINDAGKHNVNRLELVRRNGPVRPGDHCHGPKNRCGDRTPEPSGSFLAELRRRPPGSPTAGVRAFEIVAGMETEN
jgi:hypothetical protein